MPVGEEEIIVRCTLCRAVLRRRPIAAEDRHIPLAGLLRAPDYDVVAAHQCDDRAGAY